jgi:hypothetical protein
MISSIVNDHALHSFNIVYSVSSEAKKLGKPTNKNRKQYPELKINSHLLSCQKLCAKASGS